MGMSLSSFGSKDRRRIVEVRGYRTKYLVFVLTVRGLVKGLFSLSGHHDRSPVYV